MTRLFARPRFSGFGPNYLFPSSEPLSPRQVEGSTKADLRRLVRRDCPQRPGVYGMVDAHGELLYVGKAKRLRTRLLSYFRCKDRRAKPRRLLDRTATIAWEIAADEFAALLRELELIRRWRPRYNVRGQPSGIRYTYVCVGRPPASYVFLSVRLPAGTQATFGPVPAGMRAREAIRRLNDQLRLRDCPKSQPLTFADQSTLFVDPRGAGCLRFEIGTCLGPCIAACTSREYHRQIRAARAFLAGTDQMVLCQLRREMAAASAEQAYERAAALRDRLEPLDWLWHQLERLRRAQEQLQFVYRIRGADGRETWYLLRRGLVVSVVPAPRTAEDRRAVAAMIRQTYDQANPILPASAEQLAALFLVAAWFRRAPAELERTMSPDEALQLCRTV